MIDPGLDELTTQIASVLHTSAPRSDLSTMRLIAKFSPTGDAAKHDYEYRDALGRELCELPAAAARDDIYRLTRRHWQRTQDVGQARWYKMDVTVQREGRFAVEFAYDDGYVEGDVLRRG